MFAGNAFHLVKLAFRFRFADDRCAGLDKRGAMRSMPEMQFFIFVKLAFVFLCPANKRSLPPTCTHTVRAPLYFDRVQDTPLLEDKRIQKILVRALSRKLLPPPCSLITRQPQCRPNKNMVRRLTRDRKRPLDILSIRRPDDIHHMTSREQNR